MYHTIWKDLILEQKRHKKQLVVKSMLIILALGLGLFLPFPYLFLWLLVANGSMNPDVVKDEKDIHHLPHIQYILPVSRAMLKRYYLLRAGVVALFYSVVNLLGYVGCYVGILYLHDGRYEIGVGTLGKEGLHYFLLAFIISLGVFLFVFQTKVGQYAKECQVQRDTVAPVFMRMGVLTKIAAFFGMIAIASTMVYCASSMMGISIIPESLRGDYFIIPLLLALLGWCVFPWVTCRCAKQLLVADYQ